MANENRKAIRQAEINQQAQDALEKYQSVKHQRRSGILLNLGSTPDGLELAQNIVEYIRLTGWTQTRFFLIGAAKLIGDNGDNPNLIMQIAEYLGNIRKGRPLKETQDVSMAEIIDTDSDNSSSSPDSNSNSA